MLNLKHKIFVVYIAFLSFVAFLSSVVSFSFIAFFSFTLLDVNIHSFCKPQITGLIAKKTPIKLFAKYANFGDVFSLNLASKLSKHTKINNYAIKLFDSQ